MSEESKQKKAQLVDSVAEKLSRSSIVLVTDYRGLTVADVTQLRRKLREQGIDYKVIKNTLAGLAADKAGRPALKELLVGPTAIAFGYEDELPVVRTVLDYVKTSKISLTIKGGLLGARSINQAEVSSLSTMPPKGVLVAMMLGNLQAPLYRLMNVLLADLRGLATVLQARIKQQEVSPNVGS